MGINQRIKEERRRLGWTVLEMAEHAGVSKSTIVNWQNGTSNPQIEALSLLGERGIDLFFVLTGQRSAVIPGASEDQRSQITSLIDSYLCLDDVDQEFLLNTATGLVAKAVKRGTAKLVRKVAPAPGGGAESALPTSDEVQS
jgi:transcriptional regulator with XRE-family HTH domain